MKIRYFFESGTVIESIPARTTLEQFAEGVADFIAAGDNIGDIQFVQSV